MDADRRTCGLESHALCLVPSSLVGEGHRDADRRHRETRPVPLASDVLPQAQVLGSEAVDGAIGQLDVDLSADHRHPTPPRGGMKVRKLGRRIHLEGASRAGLQCLQDGVVLAEFLYHALAVRSSIHAKDTHSLSSVLYDRPGSSALSCQRRWAAAWSYDTTEDSTERFFTKYVPVTPATSGDVAR